MTNVIHLIEWQKIWCLSLVFSKSELVNNYWLFIGIFGWIISEIQLKEGMFGYYIIKIPIFINFNLPISYSLNLCIELCIKTKLVRSHNKIRLGISHFIHWLSVAYLEDVRLLEDRQFRTFIIRQTMLPISSAMLKDLFFLGGEGEEYTT